MPASKPCKGSNSRAKGARGEREAVRFLQDRFGHSYARHQDAVAGFAFAQDGSDLVPTGATAIAGLPDVQVKNHARFDVLHWLESAERPDIADGVVWMTKAPRQGWLFAGRWWEVEKIIGSGRVWQRGTFGLYFASFRA